jgi:hypothetical protein
MSKKHKSLWRVWALALGEKASPCDKESDRVAIVRSIIFLTYLLTNLFIVAGVLRHWNDETEQPTHHLRRSLRGEEATLGDACLLLTNGRSGAYHISDSGELRCRHSLLP